MTEILSEHEANEQREQEEHARIRRSNRILDQRVGSLEKHAVSVAYVDGWVKQLRQQILLAYVCILLVEVVIILHILETRRKEQEEDS